MVLFYGSVVRDYKKAKPNELTVLVGQEVRVMDATAYIRVSCIYHLSNYS